MRDRPRSIARDVLLVARRQLPLGKTSGWSSAMNSERPSIMEMRFQGGEKSSVTVSAPFVYGIL